MFEEHIRFMAMAEHELSEETTAAADQEAFNSHLNIEQINKVSSAIAINALMEKLAARVQGCGMPRQLTVIHDFDPPTALVPA